MPQCSAAVKPAASSYSIVLASASFIPIALFSSLVVIIAVIKNPFNNLRTQTGILVISSGVASLLTVPVNGLRTWYHAVNATGRNPYKIYPNVVPALHTCHAFWFATQFAGTFFFLAILLSTIFDKQCSTQIAETLKKKMTTLVTVATWTAGFAFGVGSYWTGMSLMTMIQTSLNNIVAMSCVFPAYIGWARLSKLPNDKSNSSISNCIANKNMTVSSNLVSEITSKENKAQRDGLAIEHNRAAQEEKLQELHSIFLHAILYFCCAVPSGIFLLLLLYVDSMSCSMMFCLKDASSLFMQFYLAVNNILTIFTKPQMKKAVRSFFAKRRQEVVPDTISKVNSHRN